MTNNNEAFYCKMDFTTAEHEEHQSRSSYRTIVVKANKYLVIQSNEGDIIFPGGGIEKGETPEEALCRELKEETGYLAATKHTYLGACILKKDDKYKENASYEIDCRYYSCDVEDTPVERTLTPSEIDLDITPLWMTKEEIIAGNKTYAKKLIDKDFWVEQMNWLLEKVPVLLEL